jgi:hypothetical protein
MRHMLVLTLLLLTATATAQTVTKWEAGVPWIDPGGTVTDNVDGDIPWDRVQITGDPVDVTHLGNYTVRYDVFDAAGNAAVQVVRVVTVVDTTGPVITLQGPNLVTLTVGQSLAGIFWGATAQDSFEGAIPYARFVVTGKVSTAIPRTETNPIIVVYRVSDLSGNPAVPATRTVLVLRPPDTTPPVITLKP